MRMTTPGKVALIPRLFTLRNSVVATLLVLFPLFVFTYRLQHNPPGFFIDESINGFEAYTVLKTGGFSSSGEFLPRLFRHGSAMRNHGLYIYLITPFIGLFGMNEVSVRLTSVVSSISLLAVLYFLLRVRMSEWSVLLTALWWPLTGWVFLLSRIGMEMITFALISTLVMWTLIKMYDSKEISNRHVLLFDTLIVVIFFIYAVGKVMALGYVMLALVVFVRKRLPIQCTLKLILAPVTILLLSVPYILDSTLLFRADELITECTAGFFNCLVRNVASHFSYSSYFANSYIPSDFDVYTHSIIGTSLIPRPLSVFLLIGLLVWLYRLLKRDFFAASMLAVILFGIGPTSLTIRGFDSYRSIALLPIIFILITLGLDACVWMVKRLPSLLQVFSLMVFLSGTLYLGHQEVKNLFDYEYNKKAAIDWHYGYRQILDFFLERYDQYDALIVTDTIAYVPNLYIHFYDPDGLLTKIKIGSWSDVDGNPKVLLAARPWEVDLAKFTVYKIIYFPNGYDIAFYIGEPVPPEEEFPG